MTGNDSQVAVRGTLLLLALAVAIMFVILLLVSPWLLFWRDEWDFIIRRADPSIGSLLRPHVDTFVALPALVYQALLATFGLRDYLPYLVVDWVAHVACVVLLYRIVARRSGPFVALAAGLSLTFLGSAWEVLLHPFQMQYLFAAAGGLLAIDRLDTPAPSRGRVLVAALALVIAIASSGLGGVMAGLVGLWGLLRRERAVVAAALPAVAVYAAWVALFGHERQWFTGFLTVPESLVSVGIGIGSAILGLAGVPPYRFPGIALGVAIASVGSVAVLIVRGYRPPPLAMAAAAALLAEHVLQTILRSRFGVEHGTRSAYIYPGALFLWLAIADLVGRRLERPRPVLVAGGAILLSLAIASNMRQLVGAAYGARDLRATDLATLRLIESLRSEPGIRLDDMRMEGMPVWPFSARSYLTAIDRFGRPELGWDYSTSVDQAAVARIESMLRP